MYSPEITNSFDLNSILIALIVGSLTKFKCNWVWQDLDHTVYARQAYQGGAYTYLLEMLKSESFQEPDVSIYLVYYMYLLENAK